MTAYVPFVDISHFQGNVDFRKMASHGVKAVLCKVSEGGAPDPKWPQYAHDSRAAGLWCGGYHFLNSGSSFGAEGQADKFVEFLTAVGPPLMLHMYDAEWSGVTASLRGADLAAYYVRCINRADQALGRKGSIYTIKSFWRDLVGNSPALADHDVIVATARGGVPPTDASQWGAWFEANGGIMAPKFWQIDSWPDWAACQFAVPNGIGPTYGVQSSALDLDVVKADVFARWTGQEVDPDLPLSTDDLAKINGLITANNDDIVNAVIAQLLKTNITVPVSGAPSTETPYEVLLGYLQRNVAELVLANPTGVAKPLLDRFDKVARDVNAHTDSAIAAIPPGSGGAGQDLTKVHLDSIPGHFQVDP